MSSRREILAGDLTSEDHAIWLALVGHRGARLYPVLSLWAQSAHADAHDANIMSWIEAQRVYRSRHERQYGHGRPIMHLHPLARIGMST